MSMTAKFGIDPILLMARKKKIFKEKENIFYFAQYQNYKNI